MLNQPLINTTYDELRKYVPQLLKINKSLQRAKTTIGSSYDTISFRHSIKNNISKGTNIANALTKMTREMNVIDNKNDKMWKEAVETRNQFTVLKSDIEQKLNQYKAQSDIPLKNISTNINQQSIQQQTQKQIKKEIFLDVSISQIQQLEEDEERMKEVVTNIVEIKEAQETLNDLVVEQGQKIEVISDNTGNARDNVEMANEQLVIADNNRRRSRNRKCCFMLILLLMFGMLFGLLAATGSFKN